ncbi:hypothetical protein Bca101_002587 [Brassica carinata]
MSRRTAYWCKPSSARTIYCTLMSSLWRDRDSAPLILSLPVCYSSYEPSASLKQPFDTSLSLTSALKESLALICLPLTEQTSPSPVYITYNTDAAWSKEKERLVWDGLSTQIQGSQSYRFDTGSLKRFLVQDEDIIGETLDTTGKWRMNLDDGHHAEEVKYEVEECLQPAEQRADLESINGEKRFMFCKRCLNMKALLLIGREGVFNGTVENMYLHWKYGELVKRSLEDMPLFFFRGKEYKCSPMLRLKKKASARPIKVQRREGFTKRSPTMHTREERLGAETELMEKIAE